jgi:hypothetical protein
MSPTESSHHPPIEIASLNEFRRREPEIVERINGVANGGRLFVADPLRLLREINVRLAPPVERALEQKLGAASLQANPMRRFYDEFKRDAPDASVKVVIRGVLPKETQHA